VTDERDEQDGAAPTPDAAADPAAFAERFPAPEPKRLINDEDLAWVDKPEETEERRERRRERHELHKKKVRRKRRNRRIAKVVGVGLGLFLILGIVWFRWTFGGLERMPAASGQAGLNTPGTTMLLIGSNPSEPDARAIPGTTWEHDIATSDLVMLLHLTRDNRSMFVISIPADSILPIPGRGEGKLASAFAAGGTALYARTIESYTGVALDRIAVLDMNALREITDKLDGVIIDVPREACGVAPGPRRLDGSQALDYTTLAPCLPRKDLDRVERQQSLLRALMRGAVDGGKVANPFTVNAFLKATASNLTLEQGYGYPSMLGTLWSMRNLRSANTTFLTVPVADQPNITVDGLDAIQLDPAKDSLLWDALRRDKIADYLALNQDVEVLR
jgi:LCP family protein required for cell wall assembly